MDALISARRLLSELVAGEVEDLEALAVIFLVEFLELLILRGEATFCCCVDDQEYFVGILPE